MSFDDVLECTLTSLNILVLALRLQGLVLEFLFLPSVLPKLLHQQSYLRGTQSSTLQVLTMFSYIVLLSVCRNKNNKTSRSQTGFSLPSSPLRFPQTVFFYGYAEIMENKTKLQIFGCYVGKVEVIACYKACILDRSFFCWTNKFLP